MPKKKSIQRKDSKKKSKLARAKAATRGQRSAHTKERKLRSDRHASLGSSIALQENRIGLEAPDQLGDVERMSRMERTNSESVEELAEEGQTFEAEVLAGVEEAEDSDESEVTTHEVLADDVPSEYDPER